MTPPPWVALAAYLAALAAQRLSELAISARSARALKAKGAFERGAAHWPLLVALHLAWPVALALEVALLGARPPRAWPVALAALVVAQALRSASMRALGERWCARILVVPGVPPVRRGIYRALRHPNYLGVAIELAAAPLLFGAWRTALAATLLNALALAIRIPEERRALAEAAAAPRRVS